MTAVCHTGTSAPSMPSSIEALANAAVLPLHDIHAPRKGKAMKNMVCVLTSLFCIGSSLAGCGSLPETEILNGQVSQPRNVTITGYPEGKCWHTTGRMGTDTSACLRAFPVGSTCYLSTSHFVRDWDNTTKTWLINDFANYGWPTGNQCPVRARVK